MSICYWLVAAQVGHVVTKAEITFVRGHSHWRKLRRLPQPWNSTLITLMRMEEAENGIAGIMFCVEIRTLRQSCLAERVRGGVEARVFSGYITRSIPSVTNIIVMSGQCRDLWFGTYLKLYLHLTRELSPLWYLPPKGLTYGFIILAQINWRNYVFILFALSFVLALNICFMNFFRCSLGQNVLFGCL